MGFAENEITKNAFGGTELAARSLAPLLPQNLLDQVQITSSRIRDLDPTKIRILWLHDLPEDPESSKLANPEYRNQFHHLVFVSNHQYSRYRQTLNIPYSRAHSVIEVGISPAPKIEKPTDKIRLVYSSTPQRGLAILVPVFEHLAKQQPDIHLDVFSSYAIYGWESKDAEYQSLFDKCREHPQITYHGFTPNDKLRESIDTAHIFAYPSIWEETSCRALVESMSARLLCVHPNYGALPETSGGLTFMYQGDNDLNTHASIFHQTLDIAIQAIRNKAVEKTLDGVKDYTDFRFGLKKAGHLWTNLLTSLTQEYPTEASRSLPVADSNVFRYSVN
jgi:UDP-glucose:(glucosyl)LPS alpha-1,2-glucosyltransferase